MQSQLIPVSQIKANRLNPNEMTPDQYAKLKRHIGVNEKYPSLVVIQRDNDYVLIDGHNRLRILKELKFDSAWCEVWQLDDQTANLVLATLNRLHGTDDTHKRIALLKELGNQFKGSLSELLKYIPESEQSLNAFLALEGISPDDVVGDMEQEEEGLEESLAAEEQEQIEQEQEKNDDDPRLTFVFNDSTDYDICVKYFGKKPDPSKLVSLITYYGRTNDTK